ncbi:nickel ABC transporter permease subunit NikB [Bacillus sp. FJAT-27264]|uniref:nickel ABC transporter permease n=1 Tax=Paenibacillus sp. (strain DSM 101736 / FJAT-27264) TaxID=1850362 RepID=UPI000807FE65|nr:nickel ABC transporter permease [Bacillus sp. FJAT-27264]OBZ19032.1 nickel ABC transporter permease subunit NikB [Bacillus sp. FJAT-27264]
MIRYLFQRLLHILPVLLGISCITFALMHLTPGDPAEIMLRADGVKPTSAAIEVTRHTLGLGGPVYIQYGHWLSRVLHLDLGSSYSSGRPVLTEILSRFPATALLAICGLAVALILALPLGILSALYPNRLIDRLGRVFALLSVSLPGYWLSLLLIYYGAVKLRLFPVMGMEGSSSLVLPSLALGFGMAGVYIRLIRASMLEALSQLYIKAARGRGVREWSVIGRHALRNALLPSLTLLGVQIGGLLGGSVIVETVFAWPGIGRYAVEAIFAKDYIVIQGYVLLMAVVVVLVNLVVDVGCLLLDPRIRLR